eukprot:TRINITY_DN25946_c0_g1_i1.p1 TRINITY_DN25946_c0_g1~~TRINITY_DN25946_c0_g1_i1.p1  ORF type:complete len:505 (-),score=-2.31 TRINITY_DN25946_c0_g1_i1:290-1714(-)
MEASLTESKCTSAVTSCDAGATSCPSCGCCVAGSSCSKCANGVSITSSSLCGSKRICNKEKNAPCTASTDHCLPGRSSCPACGCCAEDSSCNPCVYGAEVESSLCAGKGDRICRSGEVITDKPTTAPTPAPTRSLTPAPTKGGCTSAVTSCDAGATSCPSCGCCVAGSSCNKCANGVSITSSSLCGSKRICNKEKNAPCTASTDHCLPGRSSCPACGCCAEDSSCNHCAYGAEVESSLCAGKGDRICRSGEVITDKPTTAPTPAPTGSPTPAPTKVGCTSAVTSCDAGATSCPSCGCCVAGSSCSKCTKGVSIVSSNLCLSKRICNREEIASCSARTGHCLPGRSSCPPCGCCAEGSSCNHCVYGAEVEKKLCAGRGDRICRSGVLVTEKPTVVPTGTPTSLSPTVMPTGMTPTTTADPAAKTLAVTTQAASVPSIVGGILGLGVLVYLYKTCHSDLDRREEQSASESRRGTRR